MKNRYKKFFSTRIVLLVLLGFYMMSTTSCLTAYYTPSGGSFSGTTSYCQGSTASANTFLYSECFGTGLLATGVSCTAQWYYNTTGSTSIAASTPLGSAYGFTSSTSGSGTLNYTPLTATVGTFYYFVYVTWGSADCASPFTSGTQMVTVTAPTGAVTGAGTLCSGATSTLTGTPSGGAWSGGATGIASVSSSGVVTAGSTAGTATISYTIGGCSATGVVTVVTAPPAITPTAATILCVGATASLANAMGGGTWTSSSSSVASVNSSGVVTGIGSGTATITYSIGTGCTAAKTVTVTTPPGPVTGPASVCIGATASLSNTSPGGTWSSSATANAGISTAGVVTGLAAGTTTISYSTACPVPATMVMTVYAPPPAITGPTSVCAGGGTITLSDASPNGAWYSANAARATVSALTPTTGLVTGTGAGTVTITYTSAVGCIVSYTVTVAPQPGPILGSLRECIGGTTTLSNVVTGGTWTSAFPAFASINASTGIVTGLLAGTTYITYTDPHSCGISVATDTIIGIPNTIVGNDTACMGGTTAFASSTAGGVWSSSNPSVAIVLTTSGLISAVSTGSSVITYSIPPGCATTKTVYVVGLPSAITGPAQVCPGATIALANAAAGGAWSSYDPSVASVNSMTGIVTGGHTDTTTITYKTAIGCSASVLITVQPAPLPIAGDITVCAHLGGTLYDATPGGLWSSSNSSIATVSASGVVSTLQGGTATISYTIPATTCFSTKLIHVHPLPVPAIIYDNGTNTFYTTSAGYVSYQWYNSLQGAIPAATTMQTAAQWTGSYWVVVVDSNGCRGESLHYNYDEILVGTQQANGNKTIRVYPNPTSDIVYIEAAQKVNATVSSLDGKQLIEQADATEVNIARLAAGTYFISLYDVNGVKISVHKIIKQ